jgi:TonB-linked SusC/RagA family outer membrane protein
MRKLLLSLSIMLLVAIGAKAQERTVTGIITASEDGLPLPGVSVKVKGASTGTQTGANGQYSIRVSDNNSVLVFTYIGYATSEVSVGTRNDINTALITDAKQLGEVVVTALGVTKERRSIGYASSSIASDEILQKSEPDMLKGLQGKAAGVDIRTSQGTPGAATRIQIRGNSSFFGDNQPLIIVDGIPYSNTSVNTSSQTSGGTAYSSGISNLDPNDIASMEILKGANGAALYGSRASNGVVLITTKSGSAKRSKKGFEVNYRSSASMETIANLPEYQNDYGSGSQFNYTNSNGSWGPSFKSLSTIPTWPDYKNAYPELFGATVPYVAYPNNVKDLFKTGAVYENSITLNGGDQKNAVSLTASQLNHNGYVPNSSYDKSNISLGGSTKLDNGINVRGNLGYTSSTQKGGYFGENQVDGAASQFARSLFLSRNWDLNLPYEDKFGNNLTPNGGGQYDNPHWSSRYNTATTGEERIIANMHADFRVAKWAKLDFSLGSNVNLLKRREVTEISSRAAEGKGRLVVDDYRGQEIESNFLVTLDPKISDDFTLTTLLGFQYNQRSTSRTTETGRQFITRGIYSLSNTSQQAFTTDNTTRRRLMGLFADATVGYKNYAFVTLTGRNDWSSTLPVSNRSYFYPAVNGSFVFSDALNLPTNIVDFGKLRAGYSKVGRDADPYSLSDVFEIGTNFLGQSTAALSATSNDPNLKPEFTKSFDIGTEVSLFKKLINLDFTVYSNKSSNQIAPLTTPSSSGYTEYYTNFGSITNKGVEVELGINPFRGKALNWQISTTFSKNKNEVSELTEGVTRVLLRAVTTTVAPYAEAGMPYGYLRGTKSFRDDEGNLIINPATGGMIQDPEQGLIGDVNPNFKLGITNNLSYKGFSLGVLFDMTKGGDLYSITMSSQLGRGVTADTKDREHAVVIAGVYGDPITGKPILDANGNKIQNITKLTTNDLYFSPSATLGQTFAINTATEWNVYDATVYRLREVTLGYDIPKTMFKRLPIGAMRLSVTGRNLWYLAPNFPKYSNFDPEVNSFGASNTQGIELSAAPTTRRYGINLNVTF